MKKSFGNSNGYKKEFLVKRKSPNKKTFQKEEEKNEGDQSDEVEIKVVKDLITNKIIGI